MKAIVTQVLNSIRHARTVFVATISSSGLFITMASVSVAQSIAQQAYVKASNTNTLDQFGWAVAASGDTVVIGAPSEASNATGVNGDQNNNSLSQAGAAYVFRRGPGGWTQEAYLKASDTFSTARFGYSVAISGDTIVVGSPLANTAYGGSAYVFTRVGNQWSQQGHLRPTPDSGYAFGVSVAVSGDLVVAGGPGGSGITGVSFVFKRNQGLWAQEAALTASNTGLGDSFGTSVSISGNTVVVGASTEDSNATGVNGNQADNSAFNSGAAYVYSRHIDSQTQLPFWTQDAYLKSSETIAGMYFGNSVQISDDRVVVGAPFNTAAYVFARSGIGWTQEAYLEANHGEVGDNFGHSVSISGGTVVIGALGEDSLAAGVNNDWFNNGANGAGAAYVFIESSGSWSQQAYLKASNTEGADSFGYSVAADNDFVIVGAVSESSNATGINGNQLDNTASFSGAAYVYSLNSSATPAQRFASAINPTIYSGSSLLPDASPQQDGVSNLLKYAFNLSFYSPDYRILAAGGLRGLPRSGALPNGSSSIFRYEFLRRKDSGLIYTPQKASELNAHATWNTLSAPPTIVPIDSVWERVFYDEPYDANTTPRLFGRVQVTLPP
jgi:hypothetical protein